ncbi:MAG: UxaA family hydrolase, partial [Ornithinimicrobium sp.]|uniref:UxaA family hydrolase n=1 Tax=Ornithinimicrobium sp. TaxID=1977084 RepID=UPI003D9BEB15
VAVLPVPADNAAVAARRIDAGTRLLSESGAVTASHTVPEGHRFAVRPVAEGEPVLSWGRPFGTATRPVQAGEYLVSERMLDVLRGRLAPSALPPANIVDVALVPYELDEDTVRPGQQSTPSTPGGTFWGYSRGPGLGVGTRNHIILVATSSRTGAFVQALGRRLGDVGRSVDGLDPVVTVVHTEGGRRRWTHNRELVLRTLAGYAVHPNVGAMLAVDEPGSPVRNSDLREFAQRSGYPATGRPVGFLTRTGSVQEDLGRAEAIVRSWVSLVTAARTEQPMSALSIALQCGGSDAFSGITANPLAGAVAREVVAHGGSAILAETDELIGAEDHVVSNVRDADTARRFLAAVDRFKEQVGRHGHTAETNVSGGNLWRGLYNITIKSLGAARKLDPQVRLDYVLDYGERLTEPGYAFMDSPGNDLESIAGEVATGANVVFFTTGNGSVTNFPFVPTVKLVSTTGRYRLLPAEMDVDAGALLTGTPMEQLTRDVLGLTLEVATGRRTAGERAGHSQVSLWRDWERGPEEPAARPGDDATLDEAPDGGPVRLAGAAADAGLVELLGGLRAPQDIGLVMPTSICSGQVAQQIAERLQAAGAGAGRQFAAPVHTEGCGVSSGASERLFARVVVGHVKHPRVRDALLLEHGCEKTHNDYFRRHMVTDGTDPARYGWASIQLDGGITAVGEKVERWFAERGATRAGRGTAADPASAPSVGMHAVGPVPDRAARVFGRIACAAVAAGASVLVMEESDLIGSRAFLDVLGLATGPGATLPHGGSPVEPGLHVVARPGEDWLEVMAALVAGGAAALLVHVAGVSLPGHPFAPVLQVSADPGTLRHHAEDLDATLAPDPAADSGLTTEPAEEAATQSLARLLGATVEGRYQTRAQRSGLVGFQVSRGRLGVSM